MSSRFTQFSIMLVCCIFAASFAVAGEVHTGLKNAIDAGNVSLAKNLIEKVGVTDIYCPAGLNVTDAEKIYAQILQKDSLRIVYCIKHNNQFGCNVSHDFEMSYLEVSCNAKTRKYDNICKELYDNLYAGSTSKLYEERNHLFSRWIQERKGICLSKETIEKCKFFYDNIRETLDNPTGATSLKMEVLRILDQNKLLNFKYAKNNEKYEQFCEEKKKKNFDRNKCLRDVNRRHRDRVAECNSPGHRRTAALYDLCMSGAVRLTTNEERACESNVELVCQSKKMTEKEIISPFLDEAVWMYKSKFTDWREMDDVWVKDALMLKKYVNEDDDINFLINKYKNHGDLSIHDVVGLCKLSPMFDKKMQEKIGFELFSCNDILASHPVPCNEEKDKPKTFGASLNGSYPTMYTCEEGKWNNVKIGEKCGERNRGFILESCACDSVWRELNKLENILGACTKVNKGKIADKYICDMIWKSVAQLEIPKGSCENGVVIQSKYNPKLSYKCDEGSWIATINGEQTLVDGRDGTFYKFTKIGNQIWMAENLNYESNGSWCYGNETKNCDIFGRLYTWATAVDSARRICPEGWHLPTPEEWTILFTAVGGKETAGKVLKSTDVSWSNNGMGTNTFGFSVLPAGGWFGDGKDLGYQAKNGGTMFWSFIEPNKSNAQVIFIDGNTDAATFSDEAEFIKSFRAGIRCVKN